MVQKFSIDTTEENECDALLKSKNQSYSQKKSYMDNIFNYYQNEIEIPEDKEFDYRDMLSCVKDFEISSIDSEPWSLLSYLVKKSIPIRLVGEKEMPDDPIKGEEVLLDTLGAYRSCDGKNEPIILLCPDKILNVAENKNFKIDAKLLCKIVLIHEFAHALMDTNNWNKNQEFTITKRDTDEQKRSDAYIFMEESLASMLTLKYFKEIAKEDVATVEDFISNHQPPIYKFGITQLELIADWKEWRAYKANKNPDFWSYWAGLFTGKKIENSNN